MFKFRISQSPVRGTQGPAPWAVLVLLAFALAPVGPARAQASFQVTPVTPAPLRVTVGHQGQVSGNRRVVFNVTRSEKPSGVFASCHKVHYVDMMVDSYNRGGKVLPHYGVGRLLVEPALCSFSNRRLQTTPISDDEYRAVCAGVQRPTTKRITHAYAVYSNDNSNQVVENINGSSQGYDREPRRHFTAEVQCLGPVRGHPASGRGRPPNASCDFSGVWPVWLANGSQRKALRFVRDGKATVEFYRVVAPNGSRVQGQAFVRTVRGQHHLIVSLTLPGHPDTYATFTGALSGNGCSAAAGEYYSHDGQRITFEGRYRMQRIQGSATPRPSPVGRPSAPANANAPSAATPNWPNQTPKIPNWRKRP